MEGFLPYYENAQFDPRWLNGDATKLEGFHTIPDFELTNQDGETVTAKTFEGKIYITDFFFTTCPTVCPKMTDAMAKLQQTFVDDDEVLFLSHSVTPEIDTPDVLADYAQGHGVVSGKWHLVTGDQSVIYSLGRDYYFVEEDLGLNKRKDDFLHTDNFVLIDDDRHIRGIYSSLSRSDMRRLVEDVATLRSQPG
ncbi:MAG: SCO family protein [Deltaproteobacteria bacterium]|nr:SCO family protein [Deltaproteobacteria bacterium]